MKAKQNNRLARKLPLRLVLVVPFVVQIFLAVGLTGYLSLRNGQKAINDLAIQLQTEVNLRIKQHLDSYLSIPKQINQINIDAIELGILDLQDYDKATHFLWKQMQVFDVSYISYTLANGEYAGAGKYLAYEGTTIDELSSRTQGKSYTYATDSQGNRTQLLEVYDEYQPLTEPSYTEIAKSGKPMWSSVYNWDDDPEYLSISASYPIYNQKQELIGVFGIDLLLSAINDFLGSLEISPSGEVFIVEHNGLLIASSSPEKPFTMINHQAKRLNILQSKDPLIRKTAEYLSEKFSNFQNIKDKQRLGFELNNDYQFVQVTPWRDELGLDWLVVIVFPESDFMAQINANTEITILMCLAALGVAILLGVYTSRWISLPILRLSKASGAIASGNLTQKVTVESIREVDILSKSFNQMVGQLQESFYALEKSTLEAQNAQKAAESASQAKSQFLATVSHELRTPLNGIIGYAQILQRDKSSNLKQKEALGIIHQCGNHLLTLINDILDISKIEANKLELFPNDFHLENFLREVFEICWIKADQKEISFSYQILNPLPTFIYADEKRLRQVLINLLSNAIKFTNQGSVTFTISVPIDPPQPPLERGENLTQPPLESIINPPQPPLERGEVENREQKVPLEWEEKVIKVPLIKGDLGGSKIHRIRFQIEDTGIGITPEQLKKIFLLFEQAGDSLHKAEGTGLGLTISQNFIQIMGSEIFVESTYGKGSKFWFDLDLPEGSNLINFQGLQPQETVIGYQGEPRKILVVDDRWDNCTVIVNLLEPIGFEVIEAFNGEDGLEKTRQFHPDLIITDLAMPIMDGWQMTQQLRESAEFKDIVIIASSALNSSLNQEEMRAKGYNDFLPKPVEFSLLMNQLEHYLGLQWIYEQNQAELKTHTEEIVIPAVEELQTLYKAAKGGYILEIEAEAKRIQQLDPRYRAFTDKILSLAEAFDDEAIIKLISEHQLSTVEQASSL